MEVSNWLGNGRLSEFGIGHNLIWPLFGLQEISSTYSILPKDVKQADNGEGKDKDDRCTNTDEESDQEEA
jgi:hypothetical protein